MFFLSKKFGIFSFISINDSLMLVKKYYNVQFTFGSMLEHVTMWLWIIAYDMSQLLFVGFIVNVFDTWREKTSRLAQQCQNDQSISSGSRGMFNI